MTSYIKNNLSGILENNLAYSKKFFFDKNIVHF